MAKYTYWLTEEGLLLIEGWARDGLTDKQISKNIGISESTLNDWKKKFPEFSESLKQSKEIADRQVENALHKTALGFYYEEDMVTNQGDVVRVKKYSKPNTTAQIFWLKNRKPADWRDKQEIEQTNTNIEIRVGEWDDD
ncbi:helix-turn-helix domain-containing protein [Streptococcus uberis]|uniref:helix-turn-helix domain-containing protein n=1 Tax=Streptococcus uberis TaxID=1349 RepID=UPI0013B79C96|nr:helix-turn-helix domain-containing protein [Streptococcus uberis]MTB42542.1 helix-turn-helix domain-containing protein [Streptococcus uberis]